MEIRKAETKDREELVAFYFRLNESLNKRTGHYDPANPSYPPEEMIDDSIKNGGQFIGLEDGRIVMACIANHECPDAYSVGKWQVNAEPEQVWILHALRVAPEYEGRGFGGQMLTFLIQLAEKTGIKAIRIDVFTGYSVEQLYRRFGFQSIDTVEICYEDIGHPVSFKLMERVI